MAYVKWFTGLRRTLHLDDFLFKDLYNQTDLYAYFIFKHFGRSKSSILIEKRLLFQFLNLW